MSNPTGCPTIEEIRGVNFNNLTGIAERLVPLLRAVHSTGFPLHDEDDIVACKGAACIDVIVRELLCGAGSSVLEKNVQTRKVKGALLGIIRQCLIGQQDKLAFALYTDSEAFFDAHREAVAKRKHTDIVTHPPGCFVHGW